MMELCASRVRCGDEKTFRKKEKRLRKATTVFMSIVFRHKKHPRSFLMVRCHIRRRRKMRRKIRGRRRKSGRRRGNVVG